ncbi:HAMP domain-containing protein [Gulosibacter macacae]|uniref:histidine kinase n=1 Tax=Gulosibacter macacae TaxID=2488791 RepID=A0A3P3VX79_9MICO|nr:ATP-binding protein [Gulosibacter macacae]RRJ87074.1 HAMP domain-containing protein [Gulosibacter macacae]
MPHPMPAEPAASETTAPSPARATAGDDRSLATRLGTVRARVILALTVLTALTLVITGAIDYFVDRRSLDDHWNTSLERAYAEVHTLATTGVDPATGEPFADADSLVRLALQRTVPEPDEGLVGIVAGDLRWLAPDSVPLRLEADSELIRQALLLTQEPRSIRTTVTTSKTSYRLAVIPVSLDANSPPAALVVAFDQNPGYDELLRHLLIRLAIGALVLAIAAAVTWLIIGRILSPLTTARRTAERIGGSDLTQRIPVEGNDDLARLLETFNSMLDRLEQAFASQRELLDDVSHELRTPLTIVQGHLELMDADDPDDVLATRDLVLDELSRMERLVADLITLAKADRPDFLHRAPTPIDELLDDVLDKSRPLGDRDWQIDARPQLTLDVDQQRLTQALIQFVGNSVKHTEVGDTIALGAELDPSAKHVHLWVRDSGAGIPPEQQERIFGRFEQADGSQSNTDAVSGPLIGMGLGLGLSIVASIARAHGGHVTVDSTLGEGSTFTLVLPALRPDLDPHIYQLGTLTPEQP